MYLGLNVEKNFFVNLINRYEPGVKTYLCPPTSAHPGDEVQREPEGKGIVSEFRS